jgi:hypothetical protein
VVFMTAVSPFDDPKSKAANPLPMGGFFAEEAPGPGGLATFWGATEGLAWENATSAFAALVSHLKPRAVWMPGYICAHLSAAVPPDQRRFFGLTSGMQPDLATLCDLRPGDLVLAVNYFGMAPTVAWHSFVDHHQDMWFVEDCAQTLHSGAKAWGDWQLYSPRKLIGVAEGGLLVPISPKSQDSKMPGPALPPDPITVAQRLLPVRLRREHPYETTLWHPLHQAAEAASGLSDRAIAPEVFALLASLDPAPLIRTRKTNFGRLASILADHALIKALHPTFAPFGFPVTLPAGCRDTILARMYRKSIFPAVHWRDIATADGNLADHNRAAQMATLPCDHRYDLQDMDRLAEIFLGALD